MGRLAWVMLGGSLIYVGGMFLNDACDVEFDRAHRSERPIPAGEVGAAAVWVAGFGLLLAGWICLARLGTAGIGIGLLLVAAVVVYDVVHKEVPYAPILMALCRFLLFLVAGSAALDGIGGQTVWSGLVLGVYVVGLSYAARRESAGGPMAYWPLLLLVAPLLLAGFTNPPYAWGRSIVLMPVVIFAIWTVRCLSLLWRGVGAESTRAGVSGLLAGIVWVDVVAVMPPNWPFGMVFLGLFGLSVVLQRVVPAT